MADTIAENLEKLKTLLESYDAISTDVALIDQKIGEFTSSSDSVASQLEGLTAIFSGITEDDITNELNA